MSDAKSTPDAPPAKKHRVILILLLVILVGFLWLVYKVRTWNPNYVTKIVQADWIILKSEEGVHLIGVSCPPVEGGGLGQQAFDFTKSCVLNRYIRIEKGEQPKDEAGWVLGYVFVPVDGKEMFLNEELLRRGYGKVSPVYPNLKYRKVFEAAEAEAKSKKLGVWSPSYKPPGH